MKKGGWTALAVFALVMAPAFAQSPAPADTLAKLSASKTITLGVRRNAAPFSYIDAAGKPAGFSWALCQAIVQQLSAELKTPIAVKLKGVIARTKPSSGRWSMVLMSPGSDGGWSA